MNWNTFRSSDQRTCRMRSLRRPWKRHCRSIRRSPSLASETAYGRSARNWTMPPKERFAVNVRIRRQIAMSRLSPWRRVPPTGRHMNIGMRATFAISSKPKTRPKGPVCIRATPNLRRWPCRGWANPAQALRGKSSDRASAPWAGRAVWPRWTVWSAMPAMRHSMACISRQTSWYPCCLTRSIPAASRVPGSISRSTMAQGWPMPPP